MIPSAGHAAQPHRIRQHRRAWLVAFALFLVTMLLAVAWFGVAAGRISPPVDAIPALAADGELILDVGAAFERLKQAQGTRDNPRMQSYATRHTALLRSALADRAQIFFWKGTAGSEPDWLFFVQLPRQNRLFRDKVRRDLLAAAPQFLPAGSDQPTSASTIGYFTLTRAGLLISPTSTPARITVAPRRLRGEPPLAVYASPAGFIPPQWQDLLATCRPSGVQSLEIRWLDYSLQDGLPQGRVQLTGTSPDGAWQCEAPWIDPLTGTTPKMATKAEP